MIGRKSELTELVDGRSDGFPLAGTGWNKIKARRLNSAVKSC